MHPRVRKLLRISAYTGAAVIVLLAVAVGLFRLLLPQLPQYQLEIKQRVSELIGVDVEFSGLDARWRFSGPELICRDVVLRNPDSDADLLAANEVIVGASFLKLLSERKVVVNRLELDGVKLSVRRDEEGVFWLGQRELNELLESRPDSTETPLPKLEVQGENLEIVYTDASASRTLTPILIDDLSLSVSKLGVELESSLRTISAENAPVRVFLNSTGASGSRLWSVFLEGENLNLADFFNVLPPDIPVPRSGTGSLSLWVDLAEGRLRSSNANFDFKEVQVRREPGSDELLSADLAGQIEFTRRDNTDIAGFEFTRVRLDDRIWQPSLGEVRLEKNDEGTLTALSAVAGYLQLDDLSSFREWLPEKLRERLSEIRVSGALSDLEVELNALDTDSPVYEIGGQFEDLSLQQLGSIPGFSGLDGRLHAENTGGRLNLTTNAFSVTQSDVFSGALKFDSLRGGVTWRRGSRGLAILSDTLALSGGAIEASSNFELVVPDDGSGAILDLNSRFSVPDVSVASAYLPEKIMKPRLHQWFVDALQKGRLVDGTLLLNGRLQDFPFKNKPGTLEIAARMEDGELRFANNWPAAEVDSAWVKMDSVRLYSFENQGSVLGNRASNARVEIADLTQGELTIKVSGRSQIPNALELVRDSPLANVFGPKIVDISGTGLAQYKLDLLYPIRDKDNFKVQADIEAVDVSLKFSGLEQRLTELNGSASISRDSIASTDLVGKLLGRQAYIELLPAAAQTGYKAQAIVSGVLAAEGLSHEIPFKGFENLTGESPYRATVRFPAKAEPGEGQPFSVRLETRLGGLGITAPYPLAKSAQEERVAQLDVQFPADGQIDLSGRYAEAGRWSAVMNKPTDGPWQLERANIHLGSGESELPVGSGLYIDGAIDKLRFLDWLDFVRALQLPDRGEPVLRGIDVRAGELYGYGQLARDIGVQLSRNASDWIVQLDSERIAGAIFIPLDLSAERPLVLQMDRMMLTEVDPDAGESGDPRDYPAISFKADALQLGDRGFGAVSAEIQKTDNGLLATSVKTDAGSFRSEGTGSWLIDENGEERTRFDTDVVSSDTDAASKLLGIDSGILANDANASLRVSWDGAPRADFFGSLDGEFTIRIVNGRLDAIDPGAGRVLGLVSLIELPRRLALDFRDVFSKGLAFDKITADYRIVNGEAYTCNLSLQGPAVDIAMIGRAGLDRRDYNQTAVVSANVGNTLPAVGAVVGGPQVAAAMLVISRIFKKPLKGLGQAYYQINGSWDDPTIKRADVERFYATSQLADCLQPEP